MLPNATQYEIYNTQFALHTVQHICNYVYKCARIAQYEIYKNNTHCAMYPHTTLHASHVNLMYTVSCTLYRHCTLDTEQHLADESLHLVHCQAWTPIVHC